MDRRSGSSLKQRVADFFAFVFLAENRMTFGARLLAILLFALLFALVGDLLDVSAWLVSSFRG